MTRNAMYRLRAVLVELSLATLPRKATTMVKISQAARGIIRLMHLDGRNCKLDWAVLSTHCKI